MLLPDSNFSLCFLLYKFAKKKQSDLCLCLCVCVIRQANEGVWKKQEDYSSPSAKHGEDFRKTADFDIPTSPPLTINDLGGGNSLSNWSPHSSHSHGNPSGPHRDNHPPVPHKGRAIEELERRTAADKASSVEVRLVGNASAVLHFHPIWPLPTCSVTPFLQHHSRVVTCQCGRMSQLID